MNHFYVDKSHSNLPHIVKFSGGRSSGMLLFTMLENKMLDPKRGDVVIFNNTSAEHEETYKFVARCKKECEEKYGIPFFMIEFQTYEDSQRGIYDRFSTYRLVNDKPYSEKNPHGYHYKGEVFEELISWKAFLPSTLQRTCTKEMKMYITHHFLKDWFSSKTEIPRKGHFGKIIRSDWDELHAKHLKAGGGVPSEIFQEKKKFTYLERPHFRSEQKFQDFTTIDIDKIKSSMDYIGSAFCSFIGFRADEPGRITRMRKRIADESNYKYDVAYVKDENDEHVYAPLVEFNITEKEVSEFWNNQKWDLNLPSGGTMSNCVYCFMKGGRKLLEIARQEKPNLTGELTPANIDWWINIEKKYQRDLIAEDRKLSNKKLENPFINFFNDGKISYEKIKQAIKEEKLGEELGELLPCNCSD
ncbi:adenine nucleotide alpha hydrolase family protein [Aliarcobacter butzleri]|uniref:hypothetical protein n=1 Tax=Aliarcobacter butzleri TaxID=28197 RepID=UPI0021B2CBCD|nr:hypothetical protein [Aliarcobacter butzleri]MCT7538174.1 hypothetical protein [Aliarcobacter butzleri]MCT7624823.1 hypothetical protein [Aliarcobacter butzleri]